MEQKTLSIEETIGLMEKYNALIIKVGLASDPEKMILGIRLIRQGLKLWVEGATPK
jgi:hypothetical protein